MGARIKESDGQREVTLDAQGDTVFISGQGFCYEFDRGSLLAGVRRELGVEVMDMQSILAEANV